MASANQLFKLVHSLSKTEKAYFLKYCSLQAGDKNYLKVYKAMLKMKSYNEAVVLKKYKGETFTKSIHVTRNYLYKQILKSLRYGKVKNLIETRLFNLLTDASTLELKGLYEQSFDILRKARKLATDHSKVGILLEIVKREIYHVINIKVKKLFDVVEDYYAEAIFTVENFTQQWHYHHLNHLMFSLYREGPKLYEHASHDIHGQVMDHPVMQEFPSQGTFYAKYLYHDIRAINNLMKPDYETAKTHYEAIVEIWESHPFIIKEQPKLYKIHLSNYLNCLSRLQQFDEYPKTLEKIEKVKSVSFDEEAETFQNLSHLKLLYFMNTDQFDLAKELVPFISDGLEKYKSKINQARKITLCYNVTILYFAIQEYSNSFDWLGRIIHDKRTEIRKDMQRFARILELILHFELGNTDVLEFFFRSTLRSLRRKPGLNDYEETVLKCLNKIFFAPNKREEREMLENFEDELDGMKKSSFRLDGYEELKIWIGNKLG